MDNETKNADDLLFEQEERCLKAKKVVARACIMRLAVSVLLVGILIFGQRTPLLWGLIGLVLAVNLAGLLPLLREWRRRSREYKALCAQEAV